MMNFLGCSGVKFDKYCSKDPMINVCMDYIAGWRYDATRGAYNSYTQVLFFPGHRKSRALIDLTVYEDSKINISPLTLDAVVHDLLAKRMRFKDARMISRAKMQILNSDAVTVELSYLLPEDRLSVHSKKILVKEKIIILEKDKKFYFLRYENSAREFNKYKSAFMRIAQSMKIK